MLALALVIRNAVTGVKLDAARDVHGKLKENLTGDYSIAPNVIRLRDSAFVA